MEGSANRPPLEPRQPSATSNLDPSVPSQLPPRPPLLRIDSRSSFSPQSLRPPGPPQQRPQFQPGGPVAGNPQFAQRPPGPPVARPPLPATPGIQQIRPHQPPLRPSGPQSFAPQQGPRPLQSGLPNQLPQRVPPPNNLQFGPRPLPQTGGVTTPDSARLLISQPTNGNIRNGTPVTLNQIPRQPSQGSLKGLDISNSYQNKAANLDNQNFGNDNQNVNKTENVIETQAMAKNRSYSIAGAPGAPSPFKTEEERRKSISTVGGGRIDELTGRGPGLGLIQEGRTDSKENITGSRESLRSVTSNEGKKDITDRPESRLAGSKMTESIIGSLSTPKKRLDDDDDVVLQSKSTKNITELSDRSPSLSHSEDSPEPKQNISQPQVKQQSNVYSDQRPKTPSGKQDIKLDSTNSPNVLAKSPVQMNKKPTDLITNNPDSRKLTTPRKVASAPKSRQKDGDNDSGVDESTQGNDMNGSPGSPNKKVPSKLPTKEKSSSSIKTSLSRSSSKSATAKTPETPQPSEKKKVPMNKVQVGNAPSPNIKAVRSKIGSLDNTTYRPGGGKVKIENRKLDFNNVTPRIAAKNDAYTPSGGTKKITTTKLEWNAKSKIGSLQNAAYKPGGGDKKIETVKLDFKDKAKPKVASTANITHKPGGGAVKIENQKLEFKAQSKVGSLDNVKHKPKGGDVKIFDDKEYIKQMTGTSPLPGSKSHSRQESPTPPVQPPKSDDHYYMNVHEWSEERPMSRCRSARAPRTPRTPRALSPRKQIIMDEEEEERVRRNNERNRRASMARPASAREPPRSACVRANTLPRRPAFSVY